MTVSADQLRAREFWAWFSEAQAEITLAVSNSDHDWLRENLTPRVTALTPHPENPTINWEIGPGKTKRWQFSLSPLVKANLIATRIIIDAAPELPEWEFYPAKPPRRFENAIYRFSDDTREELEFDVRNWEYILTSLGGGRMFTIEVVGDFPAWIDEAMRRKIGHLTVEGILGEELLIERVHSIIASTKAEVDPRAPRTQIRLLEKHIRSLVA